MGRNGLGREAHPDVAADLTDPHGFAFEPHRRQPDAQMIALVDAGAGALQGGVLGPTEDV